MREKLIYTNETGRSVEISHSSLFFLESIEGLDAVKNIIYTQRSPFQDGVTEVGSSLEPRDITIRGSINATRKEEVLKHRQRLIQTFNPKLKGKLRYQAGELVREIDCSVEFAPVLSTMSNLFKKFMIQLYCPNPYLQDSFTTSEEIVTWIGGMTFPWRLPSGFATKGPKVINIVNQGDVETPVRIEFKGPATNPKITKRDTGEFIQVNRELVVGDKLVITTDFGGKRVEINGENVFNWVDLRSTFWQLQIGDNVIEYTSDEPTEPAAVVISYRNRYVGV